MKYMILIGNPGNRRTEGLQRARRQLGLPPAYVIPYLDLLQGRTSLAQAMGQLCLQEDAPQPVLRLDAPGESFEVERLLIALGAPDAPDADVSEVADEPADAGSGSRRLYGMKSCAVDGLFCHDLSAQLLEAEDALSIREQNGRLYHPSQWFRGYRRLLARLERDAELLWAAPYWLNTPADIAAMFDKRQTYRILKGAGIPVPRLLAPPGELPDYDALHSMMLRKRMHRVFVKLASGSGACGVVAYQVNPRTGAEIAVTTLGVENSPVRPPVYYNAIKPRRYSEQQLIRQLLDWLLSHGAHAEQWIAKASYKGRAFDVRQLVVDGHACHSVARLSRTPITNLHLRSERMGLEEMGLPLLTRQAIAECAEKALAAFPRSLVAGVDVLLPRDSGQPIIGELNPFGDLLYHVNYEGCDPYAWEMQRLPDFKSWMKRCRPERG